MKKALVIALLVVAGRVFADWSAPIDAEVWKLQAAEGTVRWLVIHNLQQAKQDGLYHVEVLERNVGAEPWNVRHLANHMALSDAALRASIVEPLKSGSVYPEAFNDAFAKWRAQRASGDAPICTTNVSACLQ